MNPVGIDIAEWFPQQDYLTFLAVLGWLTVGLVAWGNAASTEGSTNLAWRWFAFFAFFASLDGTLDLAKMVTPGIWPSEIDPIDPILRLVAYGCLLEFSRRGLARLGWVRLGPLVPVAIPVAALALVFYFRDSSPIPQSIVALLASVSAAVVISAFVGKGNRALLATAGALLLVAGGELLRRRDGEPLSALHGLLVTGEGLATAIFSAVLAWVAGGGLWLNAVLRQRTGVLAERQGARSPLASLALPAVIVVILVVGFRLVNWSSQRARHSIEQNYLLQVRTAALAVDPVDLERVQAAGGVEAAPGLAAEVRRQIVALRAVSQEVLRAYLWNLVDGRPRVEPTWMATNPVAQFQYELPVVGRIGAAALPAAGDPFIRVPSDSHKAPVMLLSAPVTTVTEKRQLAWLALEVSAREWLAAQAAARLQTIALVGLFASLVVFFVAHQMLREYEGELVVAKESAEAADRAKDEFLAVMSHEMRTPMQSVLGYSELLSRTPLRGVQGGYVDAIRSQGRTLLRIVQDILDFTILRKASYTLKSEEIYLHRLLGAVFESMRPLAERKELKFDFFLAGDVPEVVRGDGVRIEQILLNLLGNAVKFTDHGRVQLDVSVVRVARRQGGEVATVVFSVSDTGIGIRKIDQTRLFEPFTRLTYAENTRREGAGLGLAIVRRLCQLMGGDIELQSDWGKGTRFHVRLPLPVVAAPPEEPGGEEEVADAVAMGEILDLGAVLRVRMMVVEDNPYIRRLMIEYLRSIGYEPVALADGTEAVARWREADFLLMDLRMPGLDGVTAASRIRAESGSPTEPWIVGVSATLSEGEVTRALDAGMNDFLGKPFFVQSLIEAIKASPLYARRTGEPARVPAPGLEPPPEPPPGPKPVEAEVPAPAPPPEDAAPGEEAVPDEEPAAPAGGMSWMPDLSAGGDNEIGAQAVAEIPGLLDEIDRALGEGDKETAADRAHYLKNTIFALRMEPMIAPCRSVFERSSAGDLAAARAAMETLREAFDSWSAERASRDPG